MDEQTSFNLVLNVKYFRPRKIEPKETIEVIPDIPSDSDFR